MQLHGAVHEIDPVVAKNKGTRDLRLPSITGLVIKKLAVQD